MTRINSGIEVHTLLDTHLFSEWRELPRIPTAILNQKNKSQPKSSFSLGNGHVSFFYDKM